MLKDSHDVSVSSWFDTSAPETRNLRWTLDIALGFRGELTRKFLGSPDELEPLVSPPSDRGRRDIDDHSDLAQVELSRSWRNG